MEKKLCLKCQIEKDITDFYTNRKNGKKSSYCKICEKERLRIYRLTSNSGKIYREKNKEKLKQQNKEFRNKNTEKIYFI